MNDAIADSQYKTQPEVNGKLVSNSYNAADFSEAALPAAGAVTPSTKDGFTDIDGHWAKADIEAMAKAGVINGMTPTTFEPEGSVTRGQFVKLISAALGLNAGAAADGEHWAVPYVKAAKEAKLVNDAIKVETKDELDTPITREEMASIVASAANYKKVEVTPSNNAFTDASSISAWASADVDTAVALEIINGFKNDKDGTFSFKPAEGATRAQAATMLARLVKKIK